MIRKELTIFLIVGVLTVLVDYLSYRGIAGSGLLETSPAKVTGFLAGTVFTYFANRRWTFGARTHAAGSARRFAVLYTLTLLVNVSVNAIMLKVLSSQLYAVQGAFVIATGLSATINFIGMKHLVFIGEKLGEAT